MAAPYYTKTQIDALLTSGGLQIKGIIDYTNFPANEIQADIMFPDAEVGDMFITNRTEEIMNPGTTTGGGISGILMRLSVNDYNSTERRWFTIYNEVFYNVDAREMQTKTVIGFLPLS